MKLKSGFVVREVGGKTVAVAVGGEVASFGGMITLNETAKIIWDLLEKGTDADTVYRKIVETYGIDFETAKRDCDAFLAILENAGVIKNEE